MRSTIPTAPGRVPEPDRSRSEAGSPGTFPVVGVGASAGGLDAFKHFFRGLPADSGIAFVLIQHLDPTRKSLTADLVGTYTTMPVVQAADGMRVEANRVYVIPPNAYLAIRERTLRLSEPTAPRSRRRAVDFFLRSLALDQGENAIGIVLSGSGTDGAAGIRDIKASGGMTMVQDPHLAQHDGMPRNAIAGGHVDHVLAAEDMAARLLSLTGREAAPVDDLTAGPVAAATDPLAVAVEVLRAGTGLDFRGFRKATLRRRIGRRMGLRHVADLATYVDLLRQEPAEAVALSKDLLIHVTSFFRDPPAWGVLSTQVLRRLVADRDESTPLRVWVPACASGEEAYSLAILLIEAAEAAGKTSRVQLFASDVDAEALERARQGLYPEAISERVSAPRLARFFTRTAHGHQVDKELRDAIVFAQHDLVSDPPFSRLDLVCCRNFFIYLEPALQDRLVLLLHSALVEGGHLFLGSAEGIGRHEDLFDPVSKRWRIYRRVAPARRDVHDPSLAGPFERDRSRGRASGTPGRRGLAVLAPQVLLERYAPACVIVDRAGEILYFQGQTDDYLVQPDGLPTRDLLKLARPGLRAPLRAAMREAFRDAGRARRSGLALRRGGASRCVTVSVEPLDPVRTGIADAWLVSIEGEPANVEADPAETVAAASTAANDRVHQLEDELKATQGDLHQTIEDLRAANEELMSVNEEFQSSNEELETSKEELQSLNDELAGANTKLGLKIGELEASTSDLDNLLTSTNIATLFLDTDLRIRRFTPATSRLFSLIPSDVGRPIGDITQKFTDPELLSDVAAVLERPAAPRTEVQAHDGRWYVRQVLPYRAHGDRTEGVVVTFSDVAAEALHEARLYAESIVDTVREPLLVLDADLRVCSANRSFYATFGVAQEETVGRLLFELGGHEWDTPQLRTLLGEILPEKHVLTDFVVEAAFAKIGARIMHLNARAIDRAGDRPRRILLAIEDVTDRRRAQEALREGEARKREEEQLRQRQGELAHAQRISTIGELASGLAHELNQPLSAIANGVEACARFLRAGRSTSAELLALLDDASEEAVRAGNIIEHLRHFIEKGKPELGDANLLDIARNAMRLLGHALRQQDITLHLDLPARPVRINADRIQIEQVLVNVMQNAIDSLRDAVGEHREILLRVRVAKGVAEVAVRDSGCGVPAEAADRMFEPFFTSKRHGLGMGLAISRSILEAHGGRIWVEGGHDGERGTTVRWTLPLASSRAATRGRVRP